MAKKGDKRSGFSRPPWRAVAPFGRIGHALGFRWLFWWTMPIPYHPLIPLLLIALPLVSMGQSVAAAFAGQAPGLRWYVPLAVGLGLIAPLSIPIVNVMLLALRVQLLQGLCFLGAMVMLAAEVASGQSPVWLAALPAVYFGAWLTQLVASNLAVAGWRREARKFRPVALRGRAVALSGPQLWQEARTLLDTGQTSLVCCDEVDRTGSAGLAGNAAVRVSAEDGEKLRELLDDKSIRPSSFQMLGAEMLQARGWPVQPEVRVSHAAVEGRWQYGELRRTRLCDGEDCQEVVHGMAAPLSPFPLFMILYAVAWLGGKSRWMASFHRLRSRPVGPEMIGGRSIYHALFTPAESPAPPLDAAPFLLAIEEAQDRLLGDAIAEIERPIARREAIPSLRHWQRLERHPRALKGRGAMLCTLLERAKEERNEYAALVAAKLLAVLPERDFASLEERLMPLLGSRVLALRWKITPDLDRTPLPRVCPRFGEWACFGLMEKVPSLWERLGELGPRAARMTRVFIDTDGELAPLVVARQRFAERGLWVG